MQILAFNGFKWYSSRNIYAPTAQHRHSDTGNLRLTTARICGPAEPGGGQKMIIADQRSMAASQVHCPR